MSFFSSTVDGESLSDSQDQPMVFEEDDVANALVMRHGMMQKTIIHLNPQIATGKPKIWQLVSRITIWYIWKAKYLKLFKKLPKDMGFGQRLCIISEVLWIT